MKKPTMHDVAARAGVSAKTVSRVVNGEPFVKSSTADRVSEAIDAVGYRRNDIARMLRPGQRSLMLGLVIADLHNPFYTTIAAHIEELLRPKGYDLVIANTQEDPELERRATETLRSRQCDGLIVIPTQGSDLSEVGGPIVYVDRTCAGSEISSVVIDNERGAFNAVAHLAEQGYTRIAFVGDEFATMETSHQRHLGYRRALAAYGLRTSSDLEIRGPHSIDEATSAVRELLSSHPEIDAIFAANNRNAIGSLAAMRQMDRSVAIVGFDDFDTSGLLGLSVVTYSFEELAKGAVQLLESRMTDPEARSQQVVVPTRLIKRTSSSRNRARPADSPRGVG